MTNVVLHFGQCGTRCRKTSYTTGQSVGRLPTQPGSAGQGVGRLPTQPGSAGQGVGRLPTQPGKV